MHPEITKTLRELQLARREAARLTRRLKHLNAHKMPLYWWVPPSAERCALAVESLLEESETILMEQLKNQ